jgi:hypothetical protein
MPGEKEIEKGDLFMNSSALFLMITVQVIVTILTGWFFYKVLVSKPKEEPDSFSENDDQMR